MKAKEFSFSPQDITIVFDALQGFSPEELAWAALARNPRRGFHCEASHSPSTELATRRIAAMLRVLRKLGPNCEASSRIILPWKTAHLAQLSCLSWPEALGTRIVIPHQVPRSLRASFLARALLSMSYL